MTSSSYFLIKNIKWDKKNKRRRKKGTDAILSFYPEHNTRK
jgi:hypothetical protein